MAKEECANLCNVDERCYYATLYYVEETTVEECTLVTEEGCKDWLSYGNQLDRYLYKKGISFKYILTGKRFIFISSIRCFTNL